MLGRQRGDARAGLLEPGCRPRQLRVDAGERLAPCLEIATGHAQVVGVALGHRAVGERTLRRREVVLATLDGGALLLQPRSERAELVELPAQFGRVGDQGLEHSLVGDRQELALQAARLLAEQRVEARHAGAQRLDAGERVGEVAVTGGGECLFGVEHRHVEVAQPHPDRALTLVEVGALVAQALALGLQPCDLVTGEVDADGPQLLDQPAVTTGGVGLTLQRRELPAHLAQQVVEAQEVALGGLEPALGALAALAELEDPGGFLDDGAPVLGTRVEHRVELTLADDDVLLATDAGVGEQLLDVEQAARRAVDLVLGVAGAEQACG